MGKLKIVIYIYLFMFAFLSKTIADNSKNFFDFSLNDINDDLTNEINIRSLC